MTADYDIAVIGGGVNGCGIARDAAGRGLKVLLCEQNDLASHTSSASTKLIHGGLRYLEYGDFRLVRESLKERERLLRLAPHIIWPIRFVLPHVQGMRPVWLIRLGLFLYDHIGGRRGLPSTRHLDLSADAAGDLLRAGPRTAYEYSDCWVDDARLVVLNAMDAAERGADIRTYTKCVSMERQKSVWQLVLDSATGRQCVTARILINAAGMWADQIRACALGASAPGKVSTRMVRGSHIVVAKLFEGDRAFILQVDDNRVVFAIPYENDFTLIGTTEREYQDLEYRVQIVDEEIDYLLSAIAHYFRNPCSRDDIVWTFSGVRSLFDDGAANPSAVTRDYVLSVDGTNPPLLSVFGGKITTYRQLAEKAIDRLAPHLPSLDGRWTDSAPLPGGDFAANRTAELVSQLRVKCSGMGEAQARRLIRAYGTRAFKVIGGADSVEQLGVHFGGGLHAREVAYLMQNEWARTAEDVLWRRSKLGLHTNAGEQDQLTAWMARGRVGDAHDWADPSVKFEEHANPCTNEEIPGVQIHA